jgi:hypothetical protein
VSRLEYEEAITKARGVILNPEYRRKVLEGESSE